MLDQKSQVLTPSELLRTELDALQVDPKCNELSEIAKDKRSALAGKIKVLMTQLDNAHMACGRSSFR